MTEHTDKRAERLKAALRENLRRRKAQVRGRSDPPRSGNPEDEPPQPGDGAPRGEEDSA